MKMAFTDRPEFMVTLQLLAPEHAPDHPAKVYPAAGFGVNVMTVPPARLRQPGAPHAVPEGEVPTVPLPEVVMVRV